MSNEVTKRADNYAARYEVTNPYAAFAAEGGPGIVGKLLVCKKGDWSLGSDGDDVPAEARFLLLVDTMMRGWLKWHDGRVVEAEMGFVRDNFPVRHRYSLPNLTRASGRSYRTERLAILGRSLIASYWSKCSAPHGDVTFSGSSYGTALALKEICRVYSAEAALHPGALPVVKLTRKTRPHKQWGTIPGRGSKSSAGRPSRTLRQAARRRLRSPSLRKRRRQSRSLPRSMTNCLIGKEQGGTGCDPGASLNC